MAFYVHKVDSALQKGYKIIKTQYQNRFDQNGFLAASNTCLERALIEI